MTRRNRNELRAHLRYMLKQLLPSWRISFSIRSIINKIVMLLLVFGKLSQKVSPALAAPEGEEPRPVMIDAGRAYHLSVGELWHALSPNQRAILTVLELEMPDLAESLAMKSPETINDFFVDSHRKLSVLPIWDRIKKLENDPNFPTSLPVNTKEMRSFTQANGQLSISIVEDEIHARSFVFLSEEDLRKTTPYFTSTNYCEFTQEDKTLLVDSLQDELLVEVFEANSDLS